MTQVTQSIVFRLTAMLLVFTMLLGSTAQGVVALADAASQAAGSLWRLQAPAFSDKPTPVYRGENPGRNLQRSYWWSPKLQRDLVRHQAELALEQAMDRGEASASIDSYLMPMLVAQQNGGSGGDIGPGEGDGPGGGPGDPPGGGPGMGGSNGLGGHTNTHTGNKLTVLPIVAWPGRGDSAVAFTLTHGSVGTYNGSMGKNWSHSYDIFLTHTPGSSAILRMPDGLTVPYAEANGVFTPPSGWHSTLVRNANQTWTMTLKNQFRYEFNSAGHIVGIKDTSQNTVQIQRNASNLVTSASTPDGRQLVFAYNAENRVSSVTDPLSRSWTFGYDTSGRLTTVTYPLLNGVSHSRTFGYNANDDITSEIDLRGKNWTWTYDGAGKMTSFKTPLNHTTTYTYHPSHTVITFPNNTTRADHYANGLMSSTVDQGGFSTGFVYNANRDVTQLTDRAQKVWTYTYDSRGNRLSSTNPLNQTWLFTYSTANELRTVTNPQNHVTTYDYTSFHKLDKKTDGLNRIESRFTYDAFGQVLTEKDALNRTTTYAYNTNGDTTSITDPAGIATTLHYDGLSRVVWAKNAANQQTSVAYDNWSRAVQLTHPDGSFSTTIFNNHSQPTVHTDEMGRQELRTYDDASRLVGTTNGRGDVEVFTVNSVGQTTKVTNGRSKDTTYAFTARGELQSITMPDGSLEQWTYGARGNLTRYTDPLGNQINHVYDDAGRHLLVDYPTGTDTSLGYNASGRMTTMTDSVGTTTWAYDAAGQLASLIQPQGTLTYSYNLAGQLISQSGAGQSQTNTYDSVTGRLLSHQNHLDEVTSYQYDPIGNVSRKTFSSGQYEEFGFDNRNRPISVHLRDINNVSLRSQVYGFDASSKITSHTVNGVTTQYGYDGAGQLLSETRPGYSASYTYDGNGNRLTRTVNAATETYTYDDGDKLQDVSVGGVPIKTYEYDAAGRTKKVTSSAGQTTLTYDFDGRVTSISGPGIAQANTYNGLDTRVASTTNSVARTFLRDGASVTAPVVSDGAAFYTPGVSERRGSNTTYLHSGLKNAEAQTSVGQAVVATRSYDAFGNMVGSSGAWSGPFGYGGSFGYQSDDSGLQLLGHRYYDPSTGRFLTRDPAMDGRNWYTYCANDPISGADPTGLILETIWDAVSVAFSLHAVITEPNRDNAIALLIDITAFAAPGVPGGAGILRRIGKEGVDLAKKAADAPAKKFVPNPGGRRGGKAHRDKVQEVEDRIKAENPGWTHVAGGSEPEVLHGQKQGAPRYADLIFKNENGQEVGFQIGKQNKDGTPVKRERDALDDLNKVLAGGVNFVPY